MCVLSGGYKPPESNATAPLPVPSNNTVVPAPVVARSDIRLARVLAISVDATRAPMGLSSTTYAETVTGRVVSTVDMTVLSNRTTERRLFVTPEPVSRC